MSRQVLVSSVLNWLVANTNKPYVSCIGAYEGICRDLGDNWKFAFDVPDAVNHIKNEKPTDEYVKDKVANSWRRQNITDLEFRQEIIERYEGERNEYKKEFSEFFKLNKIKPTDDVFNDFIEALNPKEVNSVFVIKISNGDLDVDWKRPKYQTMYDRNETKNGLGFLLHSLQVLKNCYISFKKHPRYDSHMCVIYKKNNNLKLENTSVKALKLIESVGNNVSFIDVFGLRDLYNQCSDKRYSTYDFSDYLGKLETKTYRHEAINILSSVIDVLADAKKAKRLKELVGLGKESCKNRLIQYFLEDCDINELIKGYPYRDMDYTQFNVDEAIDILENRYLSYKASKGMP